MSTYSRGFGETEYMPFFIKDDEFVRKYNSI